MPKIRAKCINVRPNGFQTKRGWVDERVLTFIDEEMIPGARLLATFDYSIAKGSQEDRDWPDEKLLNQVFDLGVQQIGEQAGRQKVRLGKILGLVNGK